MDTAIFLVYNIHCPSCVSYIQDVLQTVTGVTLPIEVSLIEHTVRVRYDEIVTDITSISHALVNAAFEIKHITILDRNHVQTKSYAASTSPVGPKRDILWSRNKRKHIDNCLACQRERARKVSRWKPWEQRERLGTTMSQRSLKNMESPSGVCDDTISRADTPAIVNGDGAHEEISRPETFVARILLEGMTCSACTSAVTNELQKIDSLVSVDVSLVTNSAKIVYRGPETRISQITTAIEDIGYGAQVDEVRRQDPSSQDLRSAQLAIKGMTCGSCIGAITRGLQELPRVASVNVDLISNSGIITFWGSETIDAVRGQIDDLGYEADIVNITSLSAGTASTLERTVQIKVDGMYCRHCPSKIGEAVNELNLRDAEKPAFQIVQNATVDNSILTVTYKPSLQANVTVRMLINAINAADEAFAASVYQPPTLEERSRRLQRRERNLILIRLLFTAVVAIPTFIIGVVYMSLVSASNHTRQWLEEPLWAGMAMRMDWALFIMTTPVMAFGADLFHRRALKEIWTMWSPRSRIPLLRRFYRFGSMNLLISAGTVVAYTSSLAVLILDATTKDSGKQKQKRNSDTFFDTVVFLTLFILIGRYLEAYSKAKTGDAVAMLSSLRPSEARLIEDGALRSVPVDQLEIDDVVQIPHGQSPPTDGIVEQEGIFQFDESSLTGESRPVKKTRGDQVFTGSVNVSDAVRIRVTDLGNSSMLSQIIDVVREGQAKRAPIERYADLLTGYFVPVITLIAIVTWLIWLGLGVGGILPSAWLDVSRGGWPFWSLEFAISVFVVACPCGLGLAAPTALFVGGGLAAKNSILVQGGGEAFQEASQLTTIVFDKTGTLTQGKMKVTEFEILSTDWDEALVKAMAKVLEDASSHPIAKAVSEFCSDASAVVEGENIQELPGKGLFGTFTINSTRYEVAIGNSRLVSFLNATPDSDKNDSKVSQENDFLNTRLQVHQSRGHSTAILAIKDLSNTTPPKPQTFNPIALFAISDPIRPEAPSVLASLRQSGLDIHMCTGDNIITARAIAGQLNIPIANVRAGVLPHEKAAYIHELQHPSQSHAPPQPPTTPSTKPRTRTRKRPIIAFVGDGTNDTPALTTADVSIALSSGSDIAMTSSSFILLNPHLSTILTLTTLSRRVFNRVKMNFMWAVIYNVCLVPVAAGVFYAVGASEERGGWRLSPVWASAAMAGSSVSVVLSSLALRLPEVRWEGVRGWVLWWRR